MRAQIQMRLDEPCKVVCKIDGLTADHAKGFKEKIDDEYRINMYAPSLSPGLSHSTPEEPHLIPELSPTHSTLCLHYAFAPLMLVTMVGYT